MSGLRRSFSKFLDPAEVPTYLVSDARIFASVSGALFSSPAR